MSSTPVPSALPDFDPRQVPVIGVDTHLPAVARAAQTPAALRQRFAAPPQWQPEVRHEKSFSDRPPAFASVLVPIVLRPQPTVLLTQRTAHLSTHAGQVAFPGGRADAHDANATATALREAHEEIGLIAAQVEVLGCLPQYVTGSAFIVTPVVGLVPPDVTLHPNPGEVAEVFEVPLDFLLNPAHHCRHVMHWQGEPRKWFSMSWEDETTTRFIWGATAGILRNLYCFMAA